MVTVITVLGSGNLRTIICPDTNHEVVQIKDGDGWLCCHNETIEDDEQDAASFKCHPDAERTQWINPFLKSLRNQQIDYEI